MFNRFYTIGRKCIDFTIKSARVKYMIRCILLSMQVHMAMDKFVKDGMKYNPPISAAFVRFLTKQTGSNIEAGLRSTLSKLEEQLKLAERTFRKQSRRKKRPPSALLRLAPTPTLSSWD